MNLKLTGDLTFDTVQKHHQQIANELKNGTVSELTLEIQDVQDCDSAGLALLIEARRLCQQSQTSFQVFGASKRIHALAAFCGVNKLFENMSYD